MRLTPRQQQTFDFLRDFTSRHQHSPTMEEIGNHLGLRSPATVHNHLVALEQTGLIRRMKNVARSIEIVSPGEGNGECEVPLLGVVAAGQPIEAVLNYQTVCITRDMLGRGRTYALRVRGDSMLDEGILDGDIIICLAAETAEDGQTVVALIDGSEATVKKFYRERGAVRLEPANPRYKPLRIKPPHRVQIQGTLVGVIRRYGS